MSEAPDTIHCQRILAGAAVVSFLLSARSVERNRFSKPAGGSKRSALSLTAERTPRIAL
jgi:hypothetical protein